MEAAAVKQEARERPSTSSAVPTVAGPAAVIELSSSSDSEVEDAGGGEASSGPGKRARVSAAGEGSDKGEKRANRHRASGALPLGFLDPLTSVDGGEAPTSPPIAGAELPRRPAVIEGSKQFWKAGNYDGDSVVDSSPLDGNLHSFFVERLGDKVSVILSAV